MKRNPERQAVGEWWEFPKLVRLYHGTSSALKAQIEQHGLFPPPLNVQAHVIDLAHRVLHVPDGLAEEYERVAVDRVANFRDRSDEHGHLGASIYLTTNIREAKDYARSYAEYCGEMGYEAWRTAEAFAKKHSLARPRKLCAGGKPVVVTVLVPWNWIESQQQFKKAFLGLMKFYRNIGPEWWKSHKDIRSFKHFLQTKESTGFNIRITTPIRPEMIESITEVADER